MESNVFLEEKFYVDKKEVNLNLTLDFVKWTLLPIDEHKLRCGQ